MGTAFGINFNRVFYTRTGVRNTQPSFGCRVAPLPPYAMVGGGSGTPIIHIAISILAYNLVLGSHAWVHYFIHFDCFFAGPFNNSVHGPFFLSIRAMILQTLAGNQNIVIYRWDFALLLQLEDQAR